MVQREWNRSIHHEGGGRKKTTTNKRDECDWGGGGGRLRRCLERQKGGLDSFPACIYKSTTKKRNVKRRRASTKTDGSSFASSLPTAKEKRAILYKQPAASKQPTYYAWPMTQPGQSPRKEMADTWRRATNASGYLLP